MTGKNEVVQQYEEERKTVNRLYPPGRFVALEAGKPVTDAETHRQLLAKLLAEGKSPKDMLILEAGFDYPESVVIFL